MAFSRSFTLTSGGAAYNLICGYKPNMVRVVNKTAFATDGDSVEFLWTDSMPAGYAYAGIADAASINRAIVTSNGITAYSASSITDISQVISGATAAATCVITVASSAGYAAGQGVRIKDVVGMTELNGNLYKVLSVPSSTTVELDVDSSGFTAYSSAGVAYNQSQTIVDSGGEGVTLGTGVMGSDGEVLEVYCYMFDQGFTALGDIG
jgi:hypothetical protein